MALDVLLATGLKKLFINFPPLATLIMPCVIPCAITVIVFMIVLVYTWFYVLYVFHLWRGGARKVECVICNPV